MLRFKKCLEKIISCNTLFAQFYPLKFIFAAKFFVKNLLMNIHTHTNICVHTYTSLIVPMAFYFYFCIYLIEV